MITKWEELMMPVTSRQPRRLIDAELGQVLALAKDADSVELKLAVPDASAARPSPHWAWAPWKPRSGRCTSSTPPSQGFQVASETRAFLSGRALILRRAANQDQDGTGVLCSEPESYRHSVAGLQWNA